MSTLIRAAAAGAAACLLASGSAALAQAPAAQAAPQVAPDAIDLPDLVVTATRNPLSIQRTGSAITVIRQEEIAQRNQTSLVDVLRDVPGLDVTENGGPGATSQVRLRGGNTGHTLVLVDGIRVNDSSGAGMDFDFSNLAPGLIDRIEVLRGPQSALYGSDAIGGVVNIITKSGEGPMQIDAQIEGGSYGTVAGNASIHGRQGDWSYAFAGSAQRSDGWSRYGYRVGRLRAAFPNLEDDPYKRFGGFGRIGYDPGNGFRLELGAIATQTRNNYDAAFGALPDTPSNGRSRFGQIHAKASLDTFGDLLTHNLTLYANRTERDYIDVSYGANRLPANTFASRSGFFGTRYGAEYQADLKLNSFGTLSFGGRIERELAETTSETLSPLPVAKATTLDKGLTNRALFALWQLPIGDRTDVSLGGRFDQTVGGSHFATWRATVAHRIPEFGTKLRASVGTGGKAPSLYQLYAPIYGNATLEPEKSIGFDAGFDQSLFGGRVNLSYTAFRNNFDNLIEFDSATSRYFNVSKAFSYGSEVALDAEIWQDWVRLRAAYTNLIAQDSNTRLSLARRPQHVGRLTLIVTPTKEWSIEPTLTLVSKRYNSARQANPLAPYARLDIYTSYKFSPNWTAYLRAENVTNTRYEEVLNYGTTGRALYAGLKTTW